MSTFVSLIALVLLLIYLLNDRDQPPRARNKQPNKNTDDCAGLVGCISLLGN